MDCLCVAQCKIGNAIQNWPKLLGSIIIIVIVFSWAQFRSHIMMKAVTSSTVVAVVVPLQLARKVVTERELAKVSSKFGAQSKRVPSLGERRQLNLAISLENESTARSSQNIAFEATLVNKRSLCLLFLPLISSDLVPSQMG